MVKMKGLWFYGTPSFESTFVFEKKWDVTFFPRTGTYTKNTADLFFYILFLLSLLFHYIQVLVVLFIISILNLLQRNNKGIEVKEFKNPT